MLSNGCDGVNERQIASIDWQKAGALPAAKGDPVHLGLAGPVSGIHNNMLIIGGGANFPDSMPWKGGKKRYYDDIYVFKKDKENYRPLNEHCFKTPYPLAYGASCSTSYGVLYAGGENENGLIRTVLLISYDSADKMVVVKTLPDLPFAVANASVATDGRNVYLAGGETAEGVSDQLLHLDLKATDSSWKTLASLPQPISHSVLAATSNGSQSSLYLIGGRKRNQSAPSELFASTYRFDLKENQWFQMASLPYALSAGTGWSGGGCDILLFGGDRGKSFHKTEELNAAILKENDLSKKDSLTQQKNTVQATHPGFSREILRYDACNDSWSVIGTMPFEAPVTTTAVETAEDEVLIPSGEIRAGVRTPFILLGKISFAAKH